MNVTIGSRKIHVRKLGEMSKVDVHRSLIEQNALDYISTSEVDIQKYCSVNFEDGKYSWEAFFSSPHDNDIHILFWDTYHQVLIGYGENIFALNLANGDENWHINCADPIWELQLTPDETGLIVHEELSIKRINSDGNVIWDCFWGEIICSMELKDGLIKITDFNEQQFAIDWELGKVLHSKMSLR